MTAKDAKEISNINRNKKTLNLYKRINTEIKKRALQGYEYIIIKASNIYSNEMWDEALARLSNVDFKITREDGTVIIDWS